jgi:hypothetical protein
MLNVGHEVVITNFKSQQPHSCTCVQIETILPCANACCSPASKTSLKGKCIAQPSQDNRDDMVKKLETGQPWHAQNPLKKMLRT